MISDSRVWKVECCACVAASTLWWSSGYVVAIPPLGLTLIDEVPDRDAQVSIVGDRTYISGSREIWVLDGGTVADKLRVSHPDLGTFSNPSRVVRGQDGNVYVGATFFRTDAMSFEDGVALFALDAVDTPIATWDGRLRLVGFGSDLRGVANPRPTGQPVRLLVDGTIEDLQFPQGTLNMEGGFVTSMSKSGYAVGLAFVPGTLGDSASLWTPSGAHSFLDVGGIAYAVDERTDGQGINIGWGFGSEVVIKYGDMDGIMPKRPDGRFISSGERGLILTETDFAALGVSGTSMFFGYQPGLVPGHLDTALPIETIFPELATIHFNWISDATVVDGHIFMTISGDDGLFLFGAPAPVSIPEPASWVLLLVMAAVAVGLRVCWRGRG